MALAARTVIWTMCSSAKEKPATNNTELLRSNALEYRRISHKSANLLPTLGTFPFVDSPSRELCNAEENFSKRKIDDQFLQSRKQSCHANHYTPQNYILGLSLLRL